MPRARRKADLPTKTCAACGLPFAWRKKWARDWADVRYCSDRCRRGKAGTAASLPRASDAAAPGGFGEPPGAPSDHVSRKALLK